VSKIAVLVLVLALAPASAWAADEQAICADRPSKATGTCTVPTGRVQVETGIVDWTHDRSDGETVRFTTIGSSLLKYGIGDQADVELGVTPLEILRADGHSASGFGDTLLRVKYRLTGDAAPVEVAIDPFVKLPTAKHGLGNGTVEGGVGLAVGADIGKSGLTLSLDPELDLLADEDRHGHHAAMVQVINLGAEIGERLSVSAELWGQWDWDPSGTRRQASADGSLAYLVNNDLQLDAGANFGLNRQTPDIELYAGVSTRF
jgi:outer membrane putative beta-barrel porin/alpha-amylase